MTASEAAKLDRGTITAQIQARLNALTPSGRRVGEAVLESPLEVIHLTVTDLAERTGTSAATVVRFCQDIGPRGFSALKIRRAAESTRPERGLPRAVAVGDEPGAVLDKVLRSTAAAIQ